jgi:hypothetical protein
MRRSRHVGWVERERNRSQFYATETTTTYRRNFVAAGFLPDGTPNGSFPPWALAARLLRRSAHRNDNHLRCHCERSEAISVSGTPVSSVTFVPPLIYGEPGRAPVAAARRAHRIAGYGIPLRATAASVCHRRHCGAAGPSAHDLDVARRRRRFRGPLAPDQGELFPRVASNGGHLGQSPAQTRARGLAAPLWEHTLRDEADFARHLDYIHFNPVKRGRVERAGA